MAGIESPVQARETTSVQGTSGKLHYIYQREVANRSSFAEHFGRKEKYHQKTGN
jgi:hypothetical protein